MVTTLLFPKLSTIVTFAIPTFTAVTTPFAFTVATFLLLLTALVIVPPFSLMVTFSFTPIVSLLSCNFVTSPFGIVVSSFGITVCPGVSKGALLSVAVGTGFTEIVGSGTGVGTEAVGTGVTGAGSLVPVGVGLIVPVAF